MEWPLKVSRPEPKVNRVWCTHERRRVMGSVVGLSFPSSSTSTQRRSTRAHATAAGHVAKTSRFGTRSWLWSTPRS